MHAINRLANSSIIIIKVSIKAVAIHPSTKAGREGNGAAACKESNQPTNQPTNQ